MPRFSRNEVQSAFELWWQVGNVAEDWTRWANMFVPDVTYQDYFWGPLQGRDELDLWINAVMKGVPEIYTVYEWHIIEDEKVVFECQNRRDNPGNEGPAYFDFPGMTVLRYAGDGLWQSEFDYWDRTGARRTTKEFLTACERAGITDPMETMTRRHWPAGPDWTRTDGAPRPSWLDRPELPGIQRPSQLRELLGRP